MGFSLYVGGPDWLPSRGELRNKLKARLPDALQCLRGTVPPRSIELSTAAAGLLRDAALAAGPRDYPILSAGRYSGLLLVPRLEKDRAFPVELGSDGVVRQVERLEDAVSEAERLLPSFGLKEPLPPAWFQQKFGSTAELETFRAAGMEDPTDRGDARLLVSAIVRWGREAIEHGSCLWIVK